MNHAKSIYEVLGVALPTLSPQERQQRRLAFRNERTLYRRTCSHSGVPIVSVYSADKQFPVYENDFWWSDDWDPGQFARDFDFSRPFFEQFCELQSVIPHPALSVIKPTMVNSDFCNQAGWLKDCYLLFDSRQSERCLYGKTVERSYDCVDCLKAFECEMCYQVVNCWNCYQCTFLQNSQNSSESHYSDNLVACSHCFGCANLRNASYCLFNKKLSPEIWQREVATLCAKYSQEQLLLRFDEFRKTQIYKWMEERNTENCTGDYLVDCKDCVECFDSESLESCKYCYDLKHFSAGNFMCHDVSHFGGGLVYCGECCSVGNGLQQSFSCENVWTGENVFYSRVCTNCSEVFGCISLRNRKHCILNKQYTEDEYRVLRARIVGHMKETGEWGEFFPIRFSPWAYNETLAQEYFPITEREAKLEHWHWATLPQREASGQTPSLGEVDASKLTDEEIIAQTYRCKDTAQEYRITKHELAFYRKMSLPLPEQCFEARHARRLARKNKRHLYERRCSASGEKIVSSYPASSEKTVYGPLAYHKALS